MEFSEFARGKADDKKASLPGKRPDERLGGGAADAIVYDIGPFAAGQRPNGGFQIGAWKFDCLIGTARLLRRRTSRAMTRLR